MNNKDLRIKKIKSMISNTKVKQIGNVRFDEETYNEVVKIADEFGITKQELIFKIIQDFLIND